MDIVKLSDVLATGVVHCEFERTVTLHLADGGKLTSEYSDGEFGTGTVWSDVDVEYIDKNGKRFHVEVDTYERI